MQGRWTITHDSEGKARAVTREPDARFERNGWGAIPVVPCDDAAVERAARALDRAYDRHEMTLLEVARDVLRAAGETP